MQPHHLPNTLHHGLGCCLELFQSMLFLCWGGWAVAGGLARKGDGREPARHCV